MRLKAKLAWGGLTLLLFFVFTLALGVVRSITPANAAILVHDENNILQNAKTSVNTATTAVNTATQVALQIQMLTGMNSKGLLDHYVAISDELARMTTIVDSYEGMLAPAKNIEDYWRLSFKSIDDLWSETSSVNRHYGDSQRTLKALEKTFQDGMTTTKREIKDMEKRGKELQAAMTRSGNAVGTKEAIQAGTQIDALHAAEAMNANHQLTQLIAITSSKYQKEIQDEAAAMAINKKSADDLKARVAEIDNNKSSAPAWSQMYPPQLQKFYLDTP